MKPEQLFGSVRRDLAKEARKEQIKITLEQRDNEKIIRQDSKIEKRLRPFQTLNNRNTEIIYTVTKFTEDGTYWTESYDKRTDRFIGRVVVLGAAPKRNQTPNHMGICVIACREHDNNKKDVRFQFGFISVTDLETYKNPDNGNPIGDYVEFVKNEYTPDLNQPLEFDGERIKPDTVLHSMGLMTIMRYNRALYKRENLIQTNEQSLAMVMEAASNMELNPHLSPETRKIAELVSAHANLNN